MVYKVRQVRLTRWNGWRGCGKRPRTYVTPDKLEVGGVYMLFGGHFYRVERVL